MSSPNREALIRVANSLGPLVDELVFVGGRVAELLVTDPGGTRVRPTDDCDAVVEVTGRVGYYRFGERLRAHGFVEDNSPAAPICRWRCGNDALDVMPADGSILGFRNAWYGHALNTATQYSLEPGVTIRIAAAPVFLATKWDAFHDRGLAEDVVAAALPDTRTVAGLMQRVLQRFRQILA